MRRDRCCMSEGMRQTEMVGEARAYRAALLLNSNYAGSDTLGFWFASGEAEAARLLKTVES